MEWWGDLSSLKKWLVGSSAFVVSLAGGVAAVDQLFHKADEIITTQAEHDRDIQEVTDVFGQAIQSQNDLFVNWRLTNPKAEVIRIEYRLANEELTEKERRQLLFELEQQEKLIDCINKGEC